MEKEHTCGVVIEKCETEVPDIIANPKEVTVDNGGISLAGGAESGFSVVGAFTKKCLKKLVQGNPSFIPGYLLFTKSSTLI